MPVRKPTAEELKEAKARAIRYGFKLSPDYVVYESQEDVSNDTDTNRKALSVFTEAMRAINAGRKS